MPLPAVVCLMVTSAQAGAAQADDVETAQLRAIAGGDGERDDIADNSGAPTDEGVVAYADELVHSREAADGDAEEHEDEGGQVALKHSTARCSTVCDALILSTRSNEA